MATTHWYTAFASGNDTTGDGSKSTPYKTIQKVLDTETPTGDDQINILAAEAVTISTTLAIAATWGNPGATGFLRFRGYTTDENDGGIGVINCDATVPFINENTVDGVYLADLEIEGSTTATLVTLDDQCGLYNCYFHGGLSVVLGNQTWAQKCFFFDMTGEVTITSVLHCAFKDGNTNRFTTSALRSGSLVYNNVFSLQNDTDGIEVLGDGLLVIGNSIYSAAGTGTGIIGSAAREFGALLNNYIEGFSGSGGLAINDGGGDIRFYAGNHYFNCAGTNGVSLTGIIGFEIGTGLTLLGASGLTNPGSLDFTPVAALKEAGFPSAFQADWAALNTFLDVGAVFAECTGGGGSGVIKQVGDGGGMVG